MSATACYLCGHTGTPERPLYVLALTIPIPPWTMDPSAPREKIGESAACSDCYAKTRNHATA